MSTQAKPYVTVQEYLEAERKSEGKSEYLNGEVFAMGGASRRHSLIVTNLVRELSQQLLEGPCEVHSNDLRVRVSPTGLYTYPDVVVVCEQAQFAEEDPDTLLNPLLIVEVLSDSTKDYDRGEKFRHYRTLPSLAEYLVVAQRSIHMEHWVKQEGSWLFRDIDDATGVVRLDSVSCEISVAKIYTKVYLTGPAGQ